MWETLFKKDKIEKQLVSKPQRYLQETLVNLSAIIASLVVAPICNENQLLTWVLFVTFTVGHLLSNYMAVKVIVIDTFNTKRLFLVLQSFVRSVDEGKEVGVLTPEQANKLEPIMFFTSKFCKLSCFFFQICFCCFCVLFFLFKQTVEKKLYSAKVNKISIYSF